MKSLNLRIHLLLALERNDYYKVVLESLIPLLVLAIYNLLGLLMGWPRVIGYPSIFVAIVVVLIFFVVLRSNKLSIDWNLLEAVEDSVEPVLNVGSENKEDAEEVVATPIVEEVVIEMVEDVEELFSFTDTLTDVYNKGVPKDLAAIAARGTGMKIENIR